MSRRKIWAALFTALIVLEAGFLCAQAWGQTRASFAQAQELLGFAPAYIARAKQFKE